MNLNTEDSLVGSRETLLAILYSKQRDMMPQGLNFGHDPHLDSKVSGFFYLKGGGRGELAHKITLAI